MKRLTVILSLPACFFAHSSFAQLVPSSSFTTDWEIAAARRSNITLNYSNVEGSPYYFHNYVDCSVTLVDGSLINAPLRYDMYLDEIEYKKKDAVLWINKEDIRTIQYGKEVIAVDAMPDNPDKLAYFFVGNSGKYSLYIKKSVAYNPYIPARAYADPIPEKFVNKRDEFFLKTEGKPLQKLDNKKVLSELFSDNKPALDFIKSQKIKHDNLKDLNKLVDFLNKS